MISGNTAGVNEGGGGQVRSYGNNRIQGNGFNGCARSVAQPWMKGRRGDRRAAGFTRGLFVRV